MCQIENVIVHFGFSFRKMLFVMVVLSILPSEHNLSCSLWEHIGLYTEILYPLLLINFRLILSPCHI